MQKNIQQILKEHALKAQRSEYDRSVCISAVSKARKLIESIAETSDPNEYRKVLIDKLTDFQQNYYDPDGQYTSGKGVLGDLLGDIITALKP
ncbi:MAG: hypothetical protein HKN88_00235 [Gammaproteobacteria bacterium]|nr:hypothetical protein [Gammaproteobacteria bacterium]NNC96477.1 hypothetical protein [Gammaproteobacteria bacterium]NNM13834.1 hypothetical protein [Gammaproteobacteria bacterium]